MRILSPNIKSFWLGFCLAVSFLSVAQTTKIDSLKVKISEFEKHKKKAGISGVHQIDTLKCRLYGKLAHAYQMESSAEAEKYANIGIELSKKINYKEGQADGYNILGIMYANTGSFAKSLDYFDKNLKLRKELKSLAPLAYAYMNIGSVYNLQGNLPGALKAFTNATHLAIKAKDNYGMIAGYNNIGVLYESIGKPDEAIKSYENSLKIQKKEKNYYTLCIIQYNIGELYSIKGEYDKAMKYYNESLSTSRKSKNIQNEAGVLNSIGWILQEKGKYSEALTHMEASMKIRKEIDDQAGVAFSCLEFGKIYHKLGNNKKAEVYLKEGLAISQEIGKLSSISIAAENLSEVYSTTGKYKQAYDSQVLFKKIQDSIFNIEKDKKLTELRLTYDFNKKQDEIKLLQQKKDVATELKEKKQRNTTYFTLLALILVITFASWIFYNLRQNQKQKKIIEQQKEVVEQQNEQIQHSLTEKETLLREIHHRVKNNLQIISSLLNIQSESIQDENVLSSIQEGQSRVQAMSLIHQNLYQSEQVNNVDIDNYLRELTVYLSQMFHAESKSINVDIDTSDIQFDIDTAIPLGLIVNELVSNAYKYAFKLKDSGNININIKAINKTEYELKVNNDGTDLPLDFDIKNGKSLGLKLVTILSRQLRGGLSFSSNNGETSFVVSFKDMKAWNTAQA